MTETVNTGLAAPAHKYDDVQRALASLKSKPATDEPATDRGATPPGHFMTLAADHAAGRTVTGLPVRPTNS